ncbi:helix-turn-helix domain-containing protein [Streptomyces vinaceus]|uniref:helix-turn-helix domain-containing protein n=1 Tax=Streptomyces vinaceus TaxID=1960 RepID=UPI003687433F
MKVRADIAEQLRAGIPTRAVAAALGVSQSTVHRTRQALNLPVPSRKSTIEEAFHARTQPTPDGGHLLWTGHVAATGAPRIHWQGRNLFAHSIAFRLRTGRAPEGRAKTACGTPGCVAPAHVDDQAERNRNRTTYNALFGGAL